MEQLFNWLKGLDPLAVIIVIIVAGYVITYPFRAAVRIYYRYQRSKNIAQHGWPPAGIDSDGDQIEKEEEDEEE